MTWDPKQHPRSPDGRFRKVNLAPGEYMYKGRGGEIKKYWINEMGQMESGSTILAMASKGEVFGSFKDGRPLERIHIMGTDDHEQMAVSASTGTTFGVINHDREAPPEQFSFNRGSRYQPVGALPEGETAFGGRPAQLSERNDGKVYDTINARKAEQINQQAFDHPNAKICHADPAEFAEAAVEARHYYQDKLGMSEKAAREAPVYVYAKKDGTVMVEPVYRMDDFGNLKMRRSPNSHGGTGSVKLAGSDITRMTRAMQEEGITSVAFTISGGTNLNKNGKPLNNALHFRQDYENPTTHDNITMWGTIEQKNHGVEQVRSAATFRDPKTGRPDPEAYGKYVHDVMAIRNRNAEPYRNPKDPETAARLIRAKSGNRRIPVESVTMNPAKDGSFRVDYGNYRKYVTKDGMPYKTEPYSPKAFAEQFNKGRASSKRIAVKDVQRTEDGYFRVRVQTDPKLPETLHWRYYSPDGKPASELTLRNGEEYYYGEDGRLKPTGMEPSPSITYNPERGF